MFWLIQDIFVTLCGIRLLLESDSEYLEHEINIKYLGSVVPTLFRLKRYVKLYLSLFILWKKTKTVIVLSLA